MPRRKAVVGEDGAVQLPEMPTRPESIPENVWTLSGQLGNLGLAQRLVSVGDGAAPHNEQEAMHLAEVSEGLQRKSLKRYLKLRQTIGKKISDANDEYREHKSRTDTLVSIMMNGWFLPAASTNGHADEQCDEAE